MISDKELLRRVMRVWEKRYYETYDGEILRFLFYLKEEYKIKFGYLYPPIERAIQDIITASRIRAINSIFVTPKIEKWEEQPFIYTPEIQTYLGVRYIMEKKKWRCMLCKEVIIGDEADLWAHWYFEHAGDFVTWEEFMESIIPLNS